MAKPADDMHASLEHDNKDKLFSLLCFQCYGHSLVLAKPIDHQGQGHGNVQGVRQLFDSQNLIPDVRKSLANSDIKQHYINHESKTQPNGTTLIIKSTQPLIDEMIVKLAPFGMLFGSTVKDYSHCDAKISGFEPGIDAATIAVMLDNAGLEVSDCMIDGKLRKNGVQIDYTVFAKFGLKTRKELRNAVTHEIYRWKDHSGTPRGKYVCFCSPMAGKTIERDSGEFAEVAAALVTLLHKLDPDQDFEVTATFHDGFQAARSAGLADPAAVGHCTIHCSQKARTLLYALALSPSTGPLSTPSGDKYFGYSLECLNGKLRWYGAMVSTTPELIFRSLLEGGEKSRTAVTVLAAIERSVPLHIELEKTTLRAKLGQQTFSHPGPTNVKLWPTHRRQSRLLLRL